MKAFNPRLASTELCIWRLGGAAKLAKGLGCQSGAASHPWVAWHGIVMVEVYAGFFYPGSRFALAVIAPMKS